MNYVVAKTWPSGELGAYTYFHQVQSGTPEEAKAFADYATRETGELHDIYVLVKYEENK